MSTGHLKGAKLEELKSLIELYNQHPGVYAHHYPRKHQVSIAGSPYTEAQALKGLREYLKERGLYCEHSWDDDLCTICGKIAG